ncbi:MAG: DMT family transporter [Phormidesmis sp.]
MTQPAPAALGIALVLLSAVGLAAQNVVSRLFFVPAPLFGQAAFGGWIPPTFGNIVLILALRMGGMAVLLGAIAPILHAQTFTTLKKLPRDRQLCGYVLGSGLCLFVGLTSLYFALSQVVAGIAIAAFFIYPAITVLLAWRILHQRLRPYQLGLMTLLFIGVALTTLESNAASSANPTLGILAGLTAGLSFGLYGIFAELALQNQARSLALHPVPFSLATFLVVATLSSLSLPIIGNIEITPATWLPVLITTLFSAILTVIAYVLNNFGIRIIGASLTALISASTPALTALFAWVALQEALQGQQMAGIGLVTIGVAALSCKPGKPSADS